MILMVVEVDPWRELARDAQLAELTMRAVATGLRLVAGSLREHEHGDSAETIEEYGRQLRTAAGFLDEAIKECRRDA